MSEIPMKLIVDCITGEQQLLPFTEEELAQREIEVLEELSRIENEEAEAARIAELKASAKAKLIAGEPMTEEEAELLLG